MCGIVTEAHIEGCRSNVDYVVSVGEPIVLAEAKSPSIMKVVGDLLPLHGFKLKWLRDQPHIEDSPEGEYEFSDATPILTIHVNT